LFNNDDNDDDQMASYKKKVMIQMKRQKRLGEEDDEEITVRMTRVGIKVSLSVGSQWRYFCTSFVVDNISGETHWRHANSSLSMFFAVCRLPLYLSGESKFCRRREDVTISHEEANYRWYSRSLSVRVF